MKKIPCIVVTDLDGTLLDHHSYSYAAAEGALQRLRESGIPLILNTSKTRAELKLLRYQLRNPHPFIVENGSAVCAPIGYFAPPPADTEVLGSCDCRVFGVHYPQLLRKLDVLRPRYRFTSFSQMSAARLSELCGLRMVRAREALDRDFSEPLIWQDSERALVSFKRELQSWGLSTLRGGRFLHVLGRADKGLSLKWLRQVYCQREGTSEIKVIALGDSENDIAMLQAADVAVVIRSPAHPPPAFEAPARLLTSQREGPQGWSDSVHALLDELERQ
jgi:mannosyl-3-phosphoglycerate phosphatase